MLNIELKEMLNVACLRPRTGRNEQVLFRRIIEKFKKRR